MAVAAEPGLTAVGSGRFFAFVMGGSLPAAQAADVLGLGAWEQNVGLRHDGHAAVSAMEYAAGRWVLEPAGLPSTASVGWVTGGDHGQLHPATTGRLRWLPGIYGWDVDAQGLLGRRCMCTSSLATSGTPR